MRDRYYFCTDCESVVPEEDLKVYSLKEGDFWKQQLVCPHCKGNSLEEMEHCKICGQPIKPDEEYCEECHDAMCKAWEKLVDTVYSRRAEGNWGKSEDWQDCKYAVCDWLEDKGVV